MVKKTATEKKDKPTNPYGVNQYLLDPRQKLCWDYFIKPGTETWSNAYKSAIKAGYEESTALQITTEKWFTEKVRHINMLGKAEKVLDDMLEMPVQVLDWEGYGEDREQVVSTSPALVKIKQDTAKFVAERLGKDDGYSTRTEVKQTADHSFINVNVFNQPEVLTALNQLNSSIKSFYENQKVVSVVETDEATD